MPPRTLGHYEILSVIGRGGIGTVYRARDRRNGRPAAVKLLGPAPAVDATAARRLAREFDALSVLDHPNIVRVYEAGVVHGYSFLAMELVDGLDLRSYLSPTLDDYPTPPASWSHSPATPAAAGFDLVAWTLEPATDSLLSPLELASQSSGADEIRAFADFMEEPETDPGPAGPVPPTRDEDEPEGAELLPADAPAATPELLRGLNRPSRLLRLQEVFRQVCRGLAYLHSQRLVHRDLKPSNIMVDDSRRARIMDFGLVKPIGDAPSLTMAGRVVGTYRYMAPEQARGYPVDGRADLYSLGVILFELLCGRPPYFARSASEVWHEIVEQPPPSVRSLNPGADARLAGAAERLLRKHPAERFQTAEELLAEVGQDASGRGDILDD